MEPNLSNRVARKTSRHHSSKPYERSERSKKTKLSQKRKEDDNENRSFGFFGSIKSAVEKFFTYKVEDTKDHSESDTETEASDVEPDVSVSRANGNPVHKIEAPTPMSQSSILSSPPKFTNISTSAQPSTSSITSPSPALRFDNNTNMDIIAQAIQERGGNISFVEFEYYNKLLKDRVLANEKDRITLQQQFQPSNGVTRPTAVHAPTVTPSDLIKTTFLKRQPIQSIQPLNSTFQQPTITPQPISRFGTSAVTPQIESMAFPGVFGGSTLKRPRTAPLLNGNRSVDSDEEKEVLIEKQPKKRVFKEAIPASETAKRILDTLEQMASPLEEARTPKPSLLKELKPITAKPVTDFTPRKVEKTAITLPKNTPLNVPAKNQEEEEPPVHSITLPFEKKTVEQPVKTKKTTPQSPPEISMKFTEEVSVEQEEPEEQEEEEEEERIVLKKKTGKSKKMTRKDSKKMNRSSLAVDYKKKPQQQQQKKKIEVEEDDDVVALDDDDNEIPFETTKLKEDMSKVKTPSFNPNQFSALSALPDVGLPDEEEDIVEEKPLAKKSKEPEKKNKFDFETSKSTTTTNLFNGSSATTTNIFSTSNDKKEDSPVSFNFAAIPKAEDQKPKGKKKRGIKANDSDEEIEENEEKEIKKPLSFSFTNVTKTNEDSNGTPAIPAFSFASVIPDKTTTTTTTISPLTTSSSSTSTSSESTSFSFGLPKATENTPTDKPAFSFGTVDVSAKSNEPTFSFGGSTSTSGSSSLFGATTEKKDEKKDEPIKFSFDTKATTPVTPPIAVEDKTEEKKIEKPATPTFSFGVTSTPVTPPTIVEEKKEEKKEPISFSFGTTSTTTPTFSFGSSSSTTEKPSSPTFAVVPAVAEVPSTTSTSLSTSIFGSSTPSDAAKPAFGGFSFGNTTETKKEDSTKDKPIEFSFGATTTAPKVDAPSFTFGAATSTPATSNGGFSFGAVTPAPSTSTGLSTSFSFGSTTEAKPADSTGSFSFGAPAAASNGGFVFGAPSSTPAPASSTGGGDFVFGGSSAPASTSSTGFTFGANTSTPQGDNKPSNDVTFSFGATTPAATPSFSFGQTSQPATSDFSFGATAPTTPTSSGFTFGSTATPAFGSAAPAFGSAAPAFGSAAPAFGAPASTDFAFGAPASTPATNSFSFGATPATNSFSFGAATVDTSFAPAFDSSNAAPGGFNIGIGEQKAGRKILKGKRSGTKRGG